ncbi:unnamed protein product [Anisakis simplex]|uniref:G2/mitotic-specific cyclin-A (inferred by orthology to a D. melanogaster protein) n=1 Tax=Anisakis simplex TaxID=6269 RepID=A0A0M3JWE0_ANISI|nr:unnamed protein product [Anisakis simplex]
MTSNGALNRIAPLGDRRLTSKHLNHQLKQSSSSLSYRTIQSNKLETENKTVSKEAAISQGQGAISITSHTIKPSFSIFCDELDDDLTRDAHENQHQVKDESESFSKYDHKEVHYVTNSTNNDDSLCGSTADEFSEYHTAPLAPSDRERNQEHISCNEVYMDDIYNYMRKQELRLRPRTHYISKQSDINEEMRYILVDWLADVVLEYELQLETFHLSVSLIDRTLSVVDCPRLKLQLIGAAAIMIAAKYEEICPPSLKEYVYTTADTYLPSQILRMERVVLSVVNFNVNAPTSNWFALRLVRLTKPTRLTINTLNYLLELSLLDSTYLKYRTSLLAAAAFCLANIITGPVPWPAEIERDTGITVPDMMDALTDLLRSFHQAPKMKHKAVFEKYSDERFDAVALITAPDSLPSIHT